MAAQSDQIRAVATWLHGYIWLLDTPPGMVYHPANATMTRGAFSFSYYFWFYGYFANGKEGLLLRGSTRGN